MPTYKDKTTGKYYCKFYYQNYKGERKQKKKGGFTRKKDADNFEKDFKDRMAAAPDTPFRLFVDDYMKYKKAKVRASSYEQTERIFKKWICPYFGNKPLNKITPGDCLQWQIEIKAKETNYGRPMAPRTFINVVRQLSSAFNFAVRFYKLPENPAKKCGSIADKPKKRLDLWTLEQYKRFDSTFAPDDPNRVLYAILYYCGLRKGELQALTPADIDLNAGTISITKTFTWSGGHGHVAPDPKTEKSNRVVMMPGFLCDMIKDYMARIYDLHDNDLVFYRSDYRHRLNKHADLAGLPRIRLHDLRHSCASHLIDLGFSAFLVAEVLGHDGPRMTLDIYGHLFPSRQIEVIDRLQAEHEKEEAAKDNPGGLCILD